MSDRSNTIYRVVKNRENPYVMINKAFLSNNEMSWKAKGILSYLLSKPDNWEVRIGDLIKQSTDGRDAVYSGLKELEKFGYIVKELIRDKNGKFSQVVYNIYESPVESVDTSETEPLTENPYAENPNTVQPNTEKPMPNNNKDLVINNINNKSINQEKTNDEIERLNDVFKKCNVDLYNDSIQSVVKNTITDMFFMDEFAKKLGIPKIIVQERLLSMDMYAIDRALENYKSAVTSGIEITAPKKYFEKCLWSAINDDRLDLFTTT